MPTSAIQCTFGSVSLTPKLSGDWVCAQEKGVSRSTMTSCCFCGLRRLVYGVVKAGVWVCDGWCMGCRWLLPLASLIGSIMTADMGCDRASPGAEQGSVVGPEEPQGSPSLRGLDSSQMPTQLNDQPPPDDADSTQVCHCALIKFIHNFSMQSPASSIPFVSCQNSHTHLQTYCLISTG